MKIILIDLRYFGLNTRVRQSEHGPPDKNIPKGSSFSDFLMVYSDGQKIVFDKQERSKSILN